MRVWLKCKNDCHVNCLYNYLPYLWQSKIGQPKSLQSTICSLWVWFRTKIIDFLSHGISIPIWPSDKVSKKLVKMLCENCQIDQSAMTVADWSIPYGWPCIDGKICNGNFITGPYWNVQCQWDQVSFFHKFFLFAFLCLDKNHFPVPASSRIAKIITYTGK